jgi:hypothetical protein
VLHPPLIRFAAPPFSRGFFCRPVRPATLARSDRGSLGNRAP